MKKKAVVIFEISPDDRPIIESALRHGFEVYAVTSSAYPESRPEIIAGYKDILPSARICEIPSRFELQMNGLEYIEHYRAVVKKFLSNVGEYQVLRTNRYQGQASRAWYRKLSLKISKRFSSFRNLVPLIEDHWDKSRYLPKLSRAGVATPRIYASLDGADDPGDIDFDSFQYPCIAKPAKASGGRGVVVARTSSDLRTLFSPEPHPENFADVLLFYRKKNRYGYRHYFYHGDDTIDRYIVQEFIEGPIFSVSGALVGGNIGDFFCYNISVTDNGFCAEEAFSWPAPASVESRLQNISQEATLALGYEDGPFMFDFVQSKAGTFYLIDAAPRTSSTALRLCQNVYQSHHHTDNLLLAHFSPTPAPSKMVQPAGRAVFWKRFPFEKQFVKKIEYPDFDRRDVVDVDLKVQAGVQLNEKRTDSHMIQRGFLSTTGPTLVDAEKAWQKYFNQIKVESGEPPQ